MSTGVVVVGAGGHGKVVCDVLRSSGNAVEGFVDDGKPAGTRVLDLTVLGDVAWALRRGGRVALGIGDNARRKTLGEALAAAGCELVTAVHRDATVASSVSIGAGSVVMARAVINPDAVIDRGVILNTAAVIEHDCFVGAYAHLSPAAALGGGARIEAEAHVGLGAVVLPGIRVGERSVVGAGAVVNRDIQPGVVVRGVPARVGRALDG
jgi:sugar O-acyltransferase (sialic acid O-acetyltransferase NeuD family)